MSLIILALLAGSAVHSASALHELNHIHLELETQDPSSMKPGRCPLVPDKIATRVKDFNYTKLAGVWKVAYDEKELNT